MIRSTCSRLPLGGNLVKRYSRGVLRGSRRPSASIARKSPPLAPNEVVEQPFLLPKSFAIGSAAGVLGSLAGMGGGFVMVPLMTQSLKLCQHTAHGTSLFAVAATGVAGAFGYTGQVEWEAAAAVAGCGMFSARFGAIATDHLSGPALKKALGVFMLIVAPLVPAKAYLLEQEKNKGEISNKDAHSEKDTSMWKRFMVPGFIGVGSGFLAGLFGVGGGAVVVPALTIFTDMTHYQALGTSLCAMVPPAIVGTLTHYTKQHVCMRVAPSLALGSFIGAYVGGKYIGLKTEETTLRWGFAGLMTVLGLQTLLRG